jgi:hypothetical protein
MSPLLVLIRKSAFTSAHQLLQANSPIPCTHSLSTSFRIKTHRGDLQVALDLYRKAETYVPDNGGGVVLLLK